MKRPWWSPLAAFERYMLADDRPDYPMVFGMTLQLAGQIDRTAFERALRDALGRHPLLHALVDRTNRRRPCWVSAGDRPPDLDWDAAGVPLGCPSGAAIDLAARPGLRVWIRQDGRQGGRQDGQGAELALQFHHACCDGIGALQFVGDVLAAYGRHVAGSHDRPVPQPVDVERLATRGRLGRGVESGLSRVRAFLGGLPQMIKFAGRRPVPLCGPPPCGSAATVAPAPAESPTLPPLERHVFSEAQTQRLRDVAARHGTTLNDLLMRDMFLTVNEWNSPAGRRQRGWLRVLMPTNLRRPGDERMPAANFISLTFITRRPRECGKPLELLAGIQGETDSIKRVRRGLCFIRAIEAALALFGGMLRPFVGRRCRATVVLSNLGQIERGLAATFPHAAGRITAGNLTLEGIAVAPPIRSNTPASFMAYGYAGRLNIAALFDRKIFTRGQAQIFLREYTDRLLKTAGDEGV